MNSTAPKSTTVIGPASKPSAKKSALSFLQGSGKPKEFKKKELVQLFRGLSSMLRAQINTADAIKYYAQGLQNKPLRGKLPG